MPIQSAITRSALRYLSSTFPLSRRELAAGRPVPYHVFSAWHGANVSLTCRLGWDLDNVQFPRGHHPAGVLTDLKKVWPERMQIDVFGDPAHIRRSVIEALENDVDCTFHSVTVKGPNSTDLELMAFFRKMGQIDEGFPALFLTGDDDFEGLFQEMTAKEQDVARVSKQGSASKLGSVHTFVFEDIVVCNTVQANKRTQKRRALRQRKMQGGGGSGGAGGN